MKIKIEKDDVGMTTQTIEMAAKRLVELENSNWVKSEIVGGDMIMLLTEEDAPSVPIRYVGQMELKGIDYLAVEVVNASKRLYFEKDGRRFVLRDVSLDDNIEFSLDEVVGEDFETQKEIPLDAILMFCELFVINI